MNPGPYNSIPAVTVAVVSVVVLAVVLFREIVYIAHSMKPNTNQF